MDARVGGPFMRMKSPPFSGELRTKTWRCAVLPEVDMSQHEAIWLKRCIDYWALQEQVYGLRLSPCKMIIGKAEDGNWYCSTYVVVDKVLPGERTLDRARVKTGRPSNP